MQANALRILIAAGGTAGHLAPALVVAEHLRDHGHHVSFAVSSGRGDEQRVAARGFPLETFPISGLPRTPGPGQVAAVARAAAAVVRCMRIVSRSRAHVVLGGGGFVSAPAAIAARLRGVPVVVTEADAHLGLANRIAARFAQRLCTAYPLEDFRHKQEVTGRPVDPAFFAADRGAARASFGIGDDDLVVAVVGGSGGATRLSNAALDAFGPDAVRQVREADAGGLGQGGETAEAALAAVRRLEVDQRRLWVLHVTGRRDHGLFRQKLDAAAEPGSPHAERYRAIEYCDDMPALLAAADLVVSRAGGSVFELAAVGRASILVPFPHATADHQRKNAGFFADHDAALLLDDAQCTGPWLRELALSLLSADGRERRETLARNCRELARPDAVDRIAGIVVDAARARREHSGDAATPMGGR